MLASNLSYTTAAPFDRTKKTAIFLHAAYMSSTMWVDQIAYLEDEFPNVNLLCIDVNGHGKTTNGRKIFTLYDQCDDIAALIVPLTVADTNKQDNLSIPYAIFIGMSAGALIALRMGFTYPDRVKAIVSLSATARTPSPAFVEAFQKFQEAWIVTPTPSEELMNAAIKNWGGDLDVNSDRCKIIKRDWKKRYVGETVVPITAMTNSRDDIVEKLPEIKVPVLWVQGEKDATWTMEEAEIATAALPRAELKVIPALGHMIIFARKSVDVSEYIAGFLKEQGY